MTQPDVELPLDGGVVVGTSTIRLTSETGAADAMNPSWRYRTDTDEYTPTLVPLAPGLVSYRPPAEATGVLTLAVNNVALLRIKHSAAEESVLDAPAPTRVRRSKSGTQVSIDVDLRAKPPKSALAIVIFAITKQGTIARSWTTVSSTDKSFTVYQTPGPCEPPVPGATEAKAGERVAVAFVDLKGRLGKLSRTITVQGRK